MKIKIGTIEFNVDAINKHKFWDSVQDGTWEPETFDIMEKYLKKGYSYIDMGAWIGPTVLFGAQLAKKCYAFEPDPVAHKSLQHNLNLNPHISNVIIRTEAIGDHTGLMEFGARGEYGDSCSSFLCNKDPIIIKSITIEDFYRELNIKDCNFIKMDIEGGEFIVLPAMKDILQTHKPTLYLSLHTPWFPNKDEYMANILRILAIYKNIYNTKGDLLTLTEVAQLEGFTSIVATDK